LIRLRDAKRRLSYSIARQRGRRLPDFAARCARRFLLAYENVGNYRIDRNGERRVLTIIARHSPSVVFDVGANVGQWSSVAVELLRNADIHAFELVPTTARALTERFADEARVHTNGFGLADFEASIDVQVHAFTPNISFIETSEAALPTERCHVMRGDDYAVGHGITHIDFLKVDAEGADHLVLRGFDRLLRSSQIDVVQFEYARFALTTHFLLADFYEMFAGFGFRVGKIYPTTVAFRPYRVEDEDFRGLNFLAVRSELTDLIAELQSGP